MRGGAYHSVIESESQAVLGRKMRVDLIYRFFVCLSERSEKSLCLGLKIVGTTNVYYLYALKCMYFLAICEQ